MKEVPISSYYKETIYTPFEFSFICPADKEITAKRYFETSPRCLFVKTSEEEIHIFSIEENQVVEIKGHQFTGVTDVTRFADVVRDLAKRDIAGYSKATKITWQLILKNN